MPITILSNSGMAFFTIEKCPLVKGSNEPGNSAIFFILSLIQFVKVH